MSFAEKYLKDLWGQLELLKIDEMEGIFQAFWKTYEAGGQIFVAGNGGSAATATHLVNDLVKGAFREGKKPVKAFSLTDNVSTLTAVANDISYDDIFLHQLKVYFNTGDLVMGISASGNSPNIIKAIEYANANDGTTVGLCGFKGGRLSEIAQLCVDAPVEHYGISEDVHCIVSHMIAYYMTERIA